MCSTGRRDRLMWVAAFHRPQIAQGWEYRRGNSRTLPKSQLRSRPKQKFRIHSGSYGQDSVLGGTGTAIAL